MRTYITYQTAVRLTQFLGESAPEPMAKHYYYDGNKYPSYELCDLLSKPFLVALWEKTTGKYSYGHAITKGGYQFDKLTAAWWEGEMPAVEQELLKMIENA
jgi:hypothetical protein